VESTPAEQPRRIVLTLSPETFRALQARARAEQRPVKAEALRILDAALKDAAR
jgi:hypothetical protein